MTVSSDVLDKVILMLVSGASPEAIEQTCVDKLKTKKSDAKAAIIDARKRITIAADFNRVEEIGTAIIRLKDIYKRSIGVQDTKTALSAQKELNKLLDLYSAVQASRSPGALGDENEAATLAEQELAAIAEHLLPLELAPADYPLSGHARIAADLIRKAGAKDG